MNYLFNKFKKECRVSLSEYDKDGKDNRPCSLKILISTWKSIILFIVISVAFAYSIDFGIPINRVLFACQFFLIMQVLSFAILFLRISDCYSVFMVMQYMSMFVLGSVFFALSFYSTATLKFPLVDYELIKIDRFLGFDWLNYIGFVSQYPRLQYVLNLGYGSMIPSLIIVIFALVISKNSVHLQRFAIAYFLALAVTLFFACVLPALAGYVYYDIKPDIFAVSPVASRIHEAYMLNLRSGELHSVPEKMVGIATFPSFHAAVGLMLVWGFYPVIYLRLFMTILNTILIIAVPFSGGHYLSDIVGGLLIAIGTILLSHYILPIKQASKKQLSEKDM